jgi:hypothetical protein
MTELWGGLFCGGSFHGGSFHGCLVYGVVRITLVWIRLGRLSRITARLQAGRNLAFQRQPKRWLPGTSS